MSQIHRARNGKFSTKKAVDRIEEFVKISKSRKTSPLSASDSHIDHSYSNAFTPNDDLISDFVHVPNDLLDIGHCRFIVELDLVASQLKSCSNNSCENPLYLHKALGVRPYGLSGIVYIPCECGELNKLRLGKTHHGDNPRGVGTFDVNTKAAAGMLHSGIGESQLNNLFSTMNVHCIDAKSLKVREIEAGTAMEVFAEESEKKCLTEEAAQSNDTEEPKGISLSTDTCWHKRVLVDPTIVCLILPGIAMVADILTLENIDKDVKTCDENMVDWDRQATELLSLDKDDNNKNETENTIEEESVCSVPQAQSFANEIKKLALKTDRTSLRTRSWTLIMNF